MKLPAARGAEPPPGVLPLPINKQFGALGGVKMLVDHRSGPFRWARADL